MTERETKQITITMPMSLLEQVEGVANRLNVNRSAAVSTLISLGIEALEGISGRESALLEDLYNKSVPKSTKDSPDSRPTKKSRQSRKKMKRN